MYPRSTICMKCAFDNMRYFFQQITGFIPTCRAVLVILFKFKNKRWRFVCLFMRWILSSFQSKPSGCRSPCLRRPRPRPSPSRRRRRLRQHPCTKWQLTRSAGTLTPKKDDLK